MTFYYYKATFRLALKRFQEIWCEKQGLPKEAFEKKVLLEGLPRRYWLLGYAVWLLNRSYFSIDLDIVRQVAESTSMAEIKTGYSNFQVVKGFLRGTLRFRITKDRLFKYTSQILAENK